MTDARKTAQLIIELRDVAAELAADLQLGDESFWLWVDAAELRKAYSALEDMRANIEDARCGLKP